MSYIVKKITPTYLRANLYKLLDEVIEKGHIIELERKGEKIIISLEKKPLVFDKLERRNLTPSNITEDDLIYHGMGEYVDDPVLYNNDDTDLSTAAKPND